MTDSVLSLQSVTKTYADKIAVNNVSFDIPKGCIYGLLGPNGAGKTSIIRMITSITAPDSGKILFHNEELLETHNRQIGYLPEERGLYKKMKVREQLIYLLRLKGLKKTEAAQKTDDWLNKFDIFSWANKEVGELSKGMQQKIQFIATVSHEPSLLILDEPFSGLDPINTHIIEAEIRRLKAEGTTIIFSTHRMEQVEELCERIALINNGALILESSIEEARNSFEKGEYDIELAEESSALDHLSECTVLENHDLKFRVQLNEGVTSTALLTKLTQLPIEVTSYQRHLPRLNDIFIELITDNTAQNG